MKAPTPFIPGDRVDYAGVKGTVERGATVRSLGRFGTHIGAYVSVAFDNGSRGDVLASRLVKLRGRKPGPQTPRTKKAEPLASGGNVGAEL